LVWPLALAVAVACNKKSEAPAAPAPAAPSPAGAAKAELPARGVGMDDPFARLTADTAKALNAGYAALRAKKLDEARAAFATVIAAQPDQTTARFQQVRATVLAGQLADVPALWAELLVRDFVGYVGRLDKSKDMAPLRASPEWERVRAVETAARAAYAAGLSEGAFFVARTHATPASVPDAAGNVKLATTQEVFAYDLRSGRYRRLSETGGRVFALHVSADHKTLAYLVTPALGRLPDGASGFRDPQAAMINLTTLETTGPAAFGAAGFLASELGVCPSASGETIWSATAAGGGSASYAFDSTGAALVAVTGQTCAPDSGIEASPEGVRRLRPEDKQARLSDAGDLLEIDGTPKPIRLARKVNPTSITWSPGGKRMVYAGLLDSCGPSGAHGAAPPAAAAAAKPVARNDLYLWDAEKKRPSRITSAVSHFESAWLDDGHVLYEGGVGGAAKLFVYDVATASSTPLKVRAGGGLYGYPTIACRADSDHETEGGPAAVEPAPPAEETAE
jgi:hypothetical protein